MSSERRIESSRANGALSQGPVTPEGKRRSSRNRTTHGMYSSTVLLNGESPELYDEVLQHFRDHFQPAAKMEEYLVKQLVDCHWRMNRAATLEAAEIDHEIDRQQADVDAAYETIDASTRAALAFRKLTDTSRVLTSYRHHESGLVRQYNHLLNQLAAAQAKRKKSEFEPSPKIEHSPIPPPPTEPRA